MTNDHGNLELHTVLLSTMEDIDTICRENGLKYFLYAGTLLGAMNHKGFIPWDDDIDLAMFPDDYEKFAKILVERYPDRYTLSTLDNDPNWVSPGKKLFIKGTSFFNEHHTNTSPFFIDICILHHVPDSKWARFRQRKRLELIMLVRCVQAGKIPISSLVSKLSVGLLAKIPPSFWNRRFERVCTKYDGRYTQSVATMFDVLTPNPYNGKTGYDKDITPRQWHDHPSDVPFEGHMFMTLSDPIADLNDRYPNWQKPLPKEKRVTKHNVNTYEISPEVRERVGL